jgi:ubiquinone/menaquinone biosynthesis C-methylase UbiE
LVQTLISDDTINEISVFRGDAVNRNSFDRLAFLYNFVEKYILGDYSGSDILIDTYLPDNIGDHIIDIGGGTGYFSKRFTNKNIPVILVDSSNGMLKRIHNKSISSVLADAAELGIKNNYFDLALLINVLHHIDTISQERIINEVFRILKKHGQVFIIEVINRESFLQSLFESFERFFVGKTYHIRPDELKNLLEQNGFSSIDIDIPTKSWKYVVKAVKN